MRRRLIIRSAAVALLSVLLAMAAVIAVNRKFPVQTSGRLVFANTYANGLKIDKIVLDSSSGTTTLKSLNDFWVVAEADDYYADLKLVGELIGDFNNSTYYSRKAYSAKALKITGLNEEGLRIRTYAGDVLQDDIFLGYDAGNPDYHFVQPADRKQIWLADGSYAIPEDYVSWITDPVLHLPQELIEIIETEDGILSRFSARQPFRDRENRVAVDAPIITREAEYISVDDVKSAANFDQTRFPERRRISFYTFQGLIVTYNIYSDGREYWVNVSLSATPLPKQSVNAYIRDNKMFYDGWYFRIPAEQGAVLLSQKPI